MAVKAHGRYGQILATLYKRPGCGLCDKMLIVTRQNQKANPFQLKEVDIMKPENKTWKDIYEFDVPVLHVQKPVPAENGSNEMVLSEAIKLWHNWTGDELEDVMKRIQGYKDKGDHGDSKGNGNGKASSASTEGE